VVFRKWKQTTRPGVRAQEIHPAPRGETYLYCVEKIWRVIDVISGDKLVLQTRRGKTHVIDANDPNLRRVTLLDRIRHRDRITTLEASESSN
jgi:hypothetical protein